MMANCVNYIIYMLKHVTLLKIYLFKFASVKFQICNLN